MRSNIIHYIFNFLFIVISSSASSQTHSIEQKTVNGFRLSIYLPPGYHKGQVYKILYCNDGQTIFGSDGLNMDQQADDLLSKKLIGPLIMVGIHSDENRTSNYVPYDDEGARQDFGNYKPAADSYTQKIISKVIPFIEKEYGVAGSRGIAGYSFGGLHATWATLHYPDLFNFSAALSPSYWVDDFRLFKEASKAKKEQRYYFDMGTGEWNYYVPFIRYSSLTLLENVFYYEAADAYHNINDWRKRIPNVLLLFAGKTDTTVYTWKIHQEIIKSAATGKFYLRINPVITYSNGLTCSLSYAATFLLLNPEDGVVNTDGSFRFNGTKDLKVKIIYKNEERSLTFSYTEIEKIKSTL
ncbi:MAG: alpha/beta hydrolase-fold protein [Sediminibacterium sp.]